MRQFSLQSMIVSCCLIALLSCSKDNKLFGVPFTVNSDKTLTVTDAVKPSYFDRVVRVEGECYRVCQSEGCWLIVTDGKEKLRVTIKNKDFSAPIDLGSKKIILEGVVSEQFTSEADAREYSENAGKSEAETTSILGDQRVPVFVATSLEIK